MSFVDECDRRIRAAQRRLEKTPEENNRTTALVCFSSLFFLTKDVELTLLFCYDR